MATWILLRVHANIYLPNTLLLEIQGVFIFPHWISLYVDLWVHLYFLEQFPGVHLFFFLVFAAYY